MNKITNVSGNIIRQSCVNGVHQYDSHLVSATLCISLWNHILCSSLWEYATSFLWSTFSYRTGWFLSVIDNLLSCFLKTYTRKKQILWCLYNSFGRKSCLFGWFCYCSFSGPVLKPGVLHVRQVCFRWVTSSAIERRILMKYLNRI